MPLMGKVAHEEGVVKGDTACWESRLVGEEGRLDLLDCERTHLPMVGLKPDAIEPAAVAGDGVPHAATLEEGGRIGQ